MNKIRWGVLSTAKIAREWLIPAIQSASNAELVAIASRSLDHAQSCASEVNIPQAFGSYEDLLLSEDIDAIYNPLPNHLHVPWSIEALKSNKHVLCEKPLGMDKEDAQRLVSAASEKPELVVMEAFMYRFHPKWLKVKELIESGELGAIRHVQTSFSYFNRDPKNVRNQTGIGGGSLLDVGCYCVSVARLVFGTEPLRVNGLLGIDEEFGVDVHASATMEFANGMATFNCSSQSDNSQLVHIVGDKGRLIVDTPFHNRDDRPCRLTLYKQNEETIIEIGEHIHYVKQIEAFSDAILNHKPAPTPLHDAINNMKVIDAIFKSHQDKIWVEIS